MHRSTLTAARPREAVAPPSTTAVFVRAAGMADSTAVAWLDATLPSWREVWGDGPAAR